MLVIPTELKNVGALLVLPSTLVAVDLTLSVAGRTWINSDGKRNMPSGEVFTGPHEGSASGVVRFGVPSSPRGVEGAGVSLADERAGRRPRVFTYADPDHSLRGLQQQVLLARGEVPALVEHAVVREELFPVHTRDLAPVPDRLDPFDGLLAIGRGAAPEEFLPGGADQDTDRPLARCREGDRRAVTDGTPVRIVL